MNCDIYVVCLILKCVLFTFPGYPMSTPISSRGVISLCSYRPTRISPFPRPPHCSPPPCPSNIRRLPAPEQRRGVNTSQLRCRQTKLVEVRRHRSLAWTERGIHPPLAPPIRPKDDSAVAILDLNQSSPRHRQIIPARHSQMAPRHGTDFTNPRQRNHQISAEGS